MMRFWELLCSARGGAPVLDLVDHGHSILAATSTARLLSETAAFSSC